MPIPSPNLDDRDFEQLLGEAVSIVRRSGSPWNDLSRNDPGIVLLEAFAYLTDLMLYRLNRIPEKVHVELLRLLGVSRHPPTSAEVTLELTRRSEKDPLTVPAGTVVHSSGRAVSDTVSFVLDQDVTFSPGQECVTATAHHCDQVEHELVGTSDGQPQQRFTLERPPVVRRTGHELDLVVGVEATPEELVGRPRARVHEGIPYRVWREVESFGGVQVDERVYVVDRVSGTITFAPAVRGPDQDGILAADPAPVAAVPREGARIRAWYRRGGGSAGNVAPGVLTQIDVSGVEVTNPGRALGGRDTESLDNAIRRGSQEIHEPRRAVTADDIEALATRIGGVSRVRASTAADVWAHAAPGGVDVVLVPAADREPGARLDLAMLEAHGSARVLREVTTLLAERQPLGIRFEARWAELKPVAVLADVVVDATEVPAAVEQRVTERLNDAISPLPRPDGTSWPFGRSLRASDVFDIALREPGIRYVDAVRFELDEVPDTGVTALAADRFQPRTWYAGSRSTLFRSQNNGTGWEPVARFAGATIEPVVPHPRVAGLLGVVVTAEDTEAGTGSSRLWVSSDCGSSWPETHELGFAWDTAEQRHLVHDIAWLGNEEALLLATDRGLYSHTLGDQNPVPRVVADERTSQGLYAVAAAPTPDDRWQVVVAMQDRQGLYRSVSGPAGPFVAFGLEDEDVRDLLVEQRGLRSFLWAATFAVGDDPGRGCFRTELRVEERAGREWQNIGAGWDGGICHDIAVRADTVLAASRFNGVLTLDLSSQDPSWREPSVETSNLPLEETRRFQPVLAVDVGPSGDVVLAAGDFGVYRTTDTRTYQDTARRIVDGQVTLPPAGLFCSGDHRVTARTEDEAR